MKISALVELLSCPDDKSSMTLYDNELECNECKRKFHIDENFLDIRPKNKIDIVVL